MEKLSTKIIFVISLLALTFSVFSLSKENNYRSSANEIKPDDYQANIVSQNYIVSPDKSSLSPSEQVINNKGEKVLIKVKLLDETGKYVPNHKIRLISSSIKDSANNMPIAISDSNGEAVFQVESGDVGVNTYAGYDVTSDTLLNQRAKIAYFNSNSEIFENKTPSNYSYAAIGNSSSNVDHLKFENIPPIIKTGDSVTFTLTAYDSKEQSVLNYLGLVKFSTQSAPGAITLPGDYAFTLQDLGSHTFSLALSFKQAGIYKIKAQDSITSSVFAEYTFTVIAGSTSQSNTQSNISISSPFAGTYSNNVQVISGTAPAGSKLKIFDNNLELASISADVSGKFSYTTTPLVERNHKISVSQVNDIGTIISSSLAVEINIATSAPEASQIVLSPEGPVAPQTLVKAKLYSKEKLSKSTLLFQNNLYQLEDTAQGFYEGVFPAPAIVGEYPLTFVLVNQLGIESKIENKSVLKVVLGGATSGEGTSVQALGDVTDLKLKAGDHKITLNWKGPSLHTNPIKNYRIYYGISPNKLSEVVDTFTNAETWYIPNLKNGIEYFFAIVAVDEKGKVSANFSNIVSVVPNSSVGVPPSPAVANGTAGSEAISEMQNDSSKTGPEILWLVIPALAGGVFYGRFGVKK
ncbi:fibronectin type III domain-containing protein [Candidatus Peregrinibacteria bacterium]|nr:fibronectin type III domain-containing protein [Candidatus Peregrinibacteria bacterium]